jgi:hypothetical protein
MTKRDILIMKNKEQLVAVDNITQKAILQS